MAHGIVTDWHDIELLWESIFPLLKANSQEHPTLLTEAPLNPRSHRERAAELFFEAFGVPALHFATQAVLSLYASGRTTGVVLDSGDGVSHVVCVYEGFAIPHAVMRSDVAGRDVTEHLALLLRKAGYIFHTSAEMEVVKSIKEKTCYMSFNPQAEDARTAGDSIGDLATHLLPDGSLISVGTERYRAPELLFNPTLVGLEYLGLHELLVSAIQRADLDLRRELFASIVLAGGSTLFKGFGDRLLNEIRKVAPADVRIRVSAPPERNLSAWTGGSILASLASFSNMWITKEEYDERGPSIIESKGI
eukprot:GHVT01100607.1.p1 GENE.GHVT01100607.1~~GHVT01100607.1.p1  ORF type:complete len:306 (+),score=35.47 GHVT01100607.1:364-1281(+)